MVRQRRKNFASPSPPPGLEELGGPQFQQKLKDMSDYIRQLREDAHSQIEELTNKLSLMESRLDKFDDRATTASVGNEKLSVSGEPPDTDHVTFNQVASDVHCMVSVLQTSYRSFPSAIGGPTLAWCSVAPLDHMSQPAVGNQPETETSPAKEGAGPEGDGNDMHNSCLRKCLHLEIGSNKGDDEGIELDTAETGMSTIASVTDASTQTVSSPTPAEALLSDLESLTGHWEPVVDMRPSLVVEVNQTFHSWDPVSVELRGGIRGRVEEVDEEVASRAALAWPCEPVLTR
mmetsp:Transcript_38192/g.75738  ORF Transcript_38192/g.75738 Transcript_38192/m.75738 type:complete len:289 (+) Transcript_38192:179-1045(+)